MMQVQNLRVVDDMRERATSFTQPVRRYAIFEDGRVELHSAHVWRFVWVVELLAELRECVEIQRIKERTEVHRIPT